MIFKAWRYECTAKLKALWSLCWNPLACSSPSKWVSASWFISTSSYILNVKVGLSDIPWCYTWHFIGDSYQYEIYYKYISSPPQWCWILSVTLSVSSRAAFRLCSCCYFHLSCLIFISKESCFLVWFWFFLFFSSVKNASPTLKKNTAGLLLGWWMLHRISLKTENIFRNIGIVRKVPEHREMWTYVEEWEICSLKFVDKFIWLKAKQTGKQTVFCIFLVHI